MQYTPKQKKALSVLTNTTKKFILFAGGARAGKTYVVIRYIIIRCTKNKGSRHLICRFAFNHAKLTVWTVTLLPLLKEMFPDGGYTVNKSDYIVTFNNGSQIWLGGLDNGERVEKIMGSEYATIFVNEATQIAYRTYMKLRTRLNSKAVLTRFILDCNPRAPSHWLHRVFVDHKNPEELSEVVKRKELHAYLHFLPDDNRDKLGEGYIEDNIETMTGIEYKRYRQGLWCDSGEGGIFRFDRDINHVDEPISYDPVLETWASWDFGIADPTSIIVFQVMQIDKTRDNQKGVIINIIDEYENNNKPVSHYAEWIQNRPYQITHHCGDPAGSARSHDLKSWISELGQHGIRVKYNSFYSGKVDAMISHANNFMNGIRVCEQKTPKVVAMFENWGFETGSDEAVKDNARPRHDEYSHLGTAFYFFTINRWSPNQSSIRIN